MDDVKVKPKHLNCPVVIDILKKNKQFQKVKKFSDG